MLPKMRTHVLKMVCILVDVLEDRHREWFTGAREHTAMQCYSGDGTPVRLQKQVKFRVFGKQKQRRGKSTKEFYIQLSFYRYMNNLGVPLTSIRFAPPLALTKGLGADAQFAAGCQFSKTLREQGHRGLVINGYIFDRKGIDKLARLYHNRHKRMEHKWGKSESDVWVLQLSEWTIVQGCALHDMHNALKWSMYTTFSTPELIKDTWIVFQSVRNSFEDLQGHICLWLLQHVSFVENARLPPPHELAEFWTVLGLPADKVDHFSTKMRLCFDPATGILYASSAWLASEEDNVMKELTGVLLWFMECKSFSESRWATMRSNSEMMIGAIAVGFRSLVNFVRKQPNMLHESLSGFDKLDSRQMRFLICSMLVGKPIDRALLMLMKDNRLAMTAESIEAALEEELKIIEEISLQVWERLASLCHDGTTGQWLRTNCIRAAHVAVAFVYWRVLDSVNQLPWTLARGDQDANLTELLAGDEPDEEIAQKIYVALKRGVVSRQKIKQGLTLLLSLPWTTLTAEQAHAALSLIRKCHSEIGEEQAVCRAFLALTNKILPHLTVHEIEVKAILEEMKKLKRQNPNMSRPQNIYVQDLIALSNDLEARKKAECQDPLRAQKILRKSTEYYDKLSDERKSSYVSRNEQARQAKYVQIAKKRDEARERMRKVKVLMDEERRKTPAFQFNAARLPPAYERVIADRWTSHMYSEKNCAERIKKIMEAPPPSGVDIPPVPIEEMADRPDWFDVVCNRREEFVGCAFAFGEGDDITYNEFLFARQANPRMISFRTLNAIPAPPLSALALDDPSPWMHKFESPVGSYHRWDTIEAIQEGESVSIIPELEQLGRRQLASGHPAIPIDDFIASLPVKPGSDKPETGKAASSSSRGVTKEYAERFPWMVKKVAGIGFKHTPAIDEGDDVPDILEREVKAKMDDDEVDAYHDEIELKKEEWAELGIGVMGKAFRLSMRKGRFCMEKTGMAFNACMGQASGEKVLEFCDKYGLSTAKRYATLLFGEKPAILFARTWCHKMAYFYDIYLAQESTGYHFTQADIEGYEEPDDFRNIVGEFLEHPRKAARVIEFRSIAPSE